MRRTADLVVLDARVRSLDPAGNVHSAVAVADGRVVAVGSDEQVSELVGRGTVVVPGRGRTVLPAFTDSHTHFKRSTVVRAYFIDFRELAPRSVADVLAAVRAKAGTLARDAWVQGDGLNDLDLGERRFPVRQELDDAGGGRPVVLRSIGRHVACASSAALALAGIDRDTSSPSGGRIDRDERGEPTGVLHEQGKLRLDMTRADTVIPRFGPAERVRALAAGMRYRHARGIAGIHEMAREADEIGDYLRLREEGGLTARVRMYIRGVEAETRLEHLLALGLRSGLGDDWFRLGGVKLSIDGSGLARNAALFEPYPGRPDDTGLLRIEQDELDDAVAAAHDAGLQVAVHAVGQRAMEMAMDAFEKVDHEGSVARMRHRVEHAYFPPRPGQMERMRRLGLVWSTQPAEIFEVGDAWVQVFGEDWLEGVSPLATALAMGIPTVLNSDYPVTTIDPFVGIAAAVTRRTSSGRLLTPQESVSVDQALRMMTNGPAYVAHTESTSGSLVPGRLGDLVLLTHDPYEVPPEELAEVRVLCTVVGGRVVHGEGVVGGTS
jgi:predicted amidohydrolase YtcJ